MSTKEPRNATNNTPLSTPALPNGVTDELTAADLEDPTVSRLRTGVLIRCKQPRHDETHRQRTVLLSALMSWGEARHFLEERGWTYQDGDWVCPDCRMTEILDG